MKNKNSKKETYKKIGIGAAIVVVLAIIILLLLRSCGTPADDPGGIEFDPSATAGGWNEADLDAIRDSLNEKVEEGMATIRSREISACLVLQAQSQLKALYKDNADTIIGNCDSYLFLGGKEPSTLKELSQSLGRETIDTYNTGESRGREQSHSLNYQKLGRELMSVDDLATMDGNKCILQVRGLRPFLSDKYDITKHPNYKYLSDADKRNTFDVEKYMSRHLALKADEEYDVYEIDDLDEEALTDDT